MKALGQGGPWGIGEKITGGGGGDGFKRNTDWSREGRGKKMDVEGPPCVLKREERPAR